MLSKQAIIDFQKCWKDQFGEDISDQKAQEEGIKLLRLFKIIYRPISKKDWIKNGGEK